MRLFRSQDTFDIIETLNREARGNFMTIHSALRKAQHEAGYGASLTVERVVQIIRDYSTCNRT